MAEQETTSIGNNIDTGKNGIVLADDVAILSKERTDVALQAIYQIESLSRHLVLVADLDLQPSDYDHLIKNIGARINGLSNALCGTLDDEMETMDSLFRRISL